MKTEKKEKKHKFKLAALFLRENTGQKYTVECRCPLLQFWRTERCKMFNFGDYSAQSTKFSNMEYMHRYIAYAISRELLNGILCKKKKKKNRMPSCVII